MRWKLNLVIIPWYNSQFQSPRTVKNLLPVHSFWSEIWFENMQRGWAALLCSWACSGPQDIWANFVTQIFLWTRVWLLRTHCVSLKKKKNALLRFCHQQTIMSRERSHFFNYLLFVQETNNTGWFFVGSFFIIKKLLSYLIWKYKVNNLKLHKIK